MTPSDGCAHSTAYDAVVHVAIAILASSVSREWPVLATTQDRSSTKVRKSWDMPPPSQILSNLGDKKSAAANSGRGFTVLFPEIRDGRNRDERKELRKLAIRSPFSRILKESNI